jgi:hypothetical protein
LLKEDESAPDGVRLIPGGLMAVAAQNLRRARLVALPASGHQASRVEIMENPIVAQDPRLGAEVEAQVRHALRDEDLGPVQVRFRVCREEAEGLRFICKVENPPRVDGDGGAPPWRWWSPLLETPAQFRESLEEGLKVRRHRLALATSAR